MAKPKRKTITFRPTGFTYAALKASAAKNNRSLNQEIELHVRRSFEQASMLAMVRNEIRNEIREGIRKGLYGQSIYQDDSERRSSILMGIPGPRPLP